MKLGPVLVASSLAHAHCDQNPLHDLWRYFWCVWIRSWQRAHSASCWNYGTHTWRSFYTTPKGRTITTWPSYWNSVLLLSKVCSSCRLQAMRIYHLYTECQNWYRFLVHLLTNDNIFRYYFVRNMMPVFCKNVIIFGSLVWKKAMTQRSYFVLYINIHVTNAAYLCFMWISTVGFCLFSFSNL